MSPEYEEHQLHYRKRSPFTAGNDDGGCTTTKNIQGEKANRRRTDVDKDKLQTGLCSLLSRDEYESSNVGT